ncbi:MAG: (d)CMP kinase [Chthoniobacterales bacterium]
MRVFHVIAIDGPAASGKSSVARALARRLGFAYVNSGALYRAVTWHILQRRVDVRDCAAVSAAIGQTQIVCDLSHGESRICIGGIDPSPHLREDDVNYSVSLVSSVPRVREILGEQMRAYARTHDVVMEGRDIGSVVFPDTPFKFYIDASPEVRVRRREAQGGRDEIASRDRLDSSRETAPLVVAPDADVIDSSHVSVDEVVNRVLRRLASKGLTEAKQPVLPEQGA